MSHQDRPLYAQVAEHIRGKIRREELRPGDLVPPDRDLADEQGVSRGTAVRALDLLVSEGLITAGATRAGRRVRDKRVLSIHASRSESVADRRAAGIDAWVTDIQEYGLTPGQRIDVGVVNADEQLARNLQVEVGDPVAVRRRLRTLDGEPSNTSDSYYPMPLARDVPEILDPADVPQGVIALMAEKGVVQTHYTDRLRWRPPTPEEAEKLRVGPGVAVLVQTRIGHMNDRVVRVTEQVWPGDTIEIVYELPA